MTNPKPPYVLERLSEAPEIFIDGYQGALIGNGVIKLNCFSTYTDAEGAPHYVCTQRLAMSLATLVQVRDAFNDLIAQLERDGHVVATSAANA